MPLGEMDDSQKQQMTQLYGEMEDNLNGTIPTEIANLVKLKTLDISGNKLRGHMTQEALSIEKVYAQGNYMYFCLHSPIQIV